MRKIKFNAGDSVTFAIKLPDSYDPINLEGLTLKIGNSRIWKLGDGILPTDDPRIFRAELNSNQTAKMSYGFPIEVAITDAVFGNKVEIIGEVYVTETLGFGINGVNQGIDFLIEITEIATEVISDVRLLAINKGDKGEPGEQNIVTINIAEKGNGDVITHGYNATLRIITFYDNNDGGRQRNVLFANEQTTDEFTLNNDFSNDKLTGTLLCVKY